MAPFLSILQDFEVWQRFERIVLVYSVREARELAYQDLINGFARRDYLAEHAHKLTYLRPSPASSGPARCTGASPRCWKPGNWNALPVCRSAPSTRASCSAATRR